MPFLMYCLAADRLPAGYSAILNATTPLTGAIIGFCLFGEPMTVRKWLGVLLGIGGVMLITTTDPASQAGGAITGILLCLVATSCYGLAGFLARRWIADKGGLAPEMVACGSQWGASLFMLPFFIGNISSGAPAHWGETSAWLSVVAVGLFCTAWAYILYFRLLADIGPLRSFSVTFLIPPFAVLWGYLVPGETLNRGFIAGAVIIGLSVWMMVGSPVAPRQRDVSASR